MGFVEFLKDVCTEESSHVDFVLSAIPTSASEENIARLPDFCDSVLKSGSYIFLIVSHQYIFELEILFTNPNFKVCPYQ